MKYLQYALAGVLFSISAWATSYALKVSEDRKTIAKEIVSLDKTIERAAIAAERTNVMLYNYTKTHSQNLARITEVLVRHEQAIHNKGEKNDTNRR